MTEEQAAETSAHEPADEGEDAVERGDDDVVDGDDVGEGMDVMDEDDDGQKVLLLFVLCMQYSTVYCLLVGVETPTISSLWKRKKFFLGAFHMRHVYICITGCWTDASLPEFVVFKNTIAFLLFAGEGSCRRARDDRRASGISRGKSKKRYQEGQGRPSSR